MNNSTFLSRNFSSEIKSISKFDLESYCKDIPPKRIHAILNKDILDMYDFAALLSDTAFTFIEQIAQKASQITRANFGNVIFIFTPLYISNYCQNTCVYCSFARQHHISRKHLTVDEIEFEAKKIAATGIRHVLFLTGEAPSVVNMEYLKSAVTVLRKYFSSISMEIYPLKQHEYGELIACGVDGLTLYQETYNKTLYHRLHEGGPKNDFEFRLDAPDRACRESIRAVTVGALLGLDNWRQEALFTGLHAHHLSNSYPEVEISVSFPRIRPLAGDFQPLSPVSDKQFVQMLLAVRLFLPHAGITVSTRESEQFRNSLLPLGVTKMSAGVSTSVGTHSGETSTAQFEIADTRSLETLKSDLMKKGFQPVLHDWSRNLF